jgi:hypothetical protein
MSFRDSLTILVLNPDSNHTALQITTRTIASHFPECSVVCAVSKDDELAENKRFAEVVQGGNTITSLIDAGVKHCKTKWCFIVTAGTYLRRHHLRKYDLFCRGEKEILYPVVDKKYAFDEATINGILIPKKAIEEVGNFGDNNRSIQLVKMLWAIQALEHGYCFRALVGARLI